MIKSIVSSNQYIIMFPSPHLIGYWSVEMPVCGRNPSKSLHNHPQMLLRVSFLCFGNHYEVDTTLALCVCVCVCVADLTAAAHCFAIEWGPGDGRVIIKRHGRRINIWIH